MPERPTPSPACLQTDHARLEGVLRAATRVSIIATDAQGLIQVFNPGAERMLGYSAGEVIGRHTPELIHLDQEVRAQGRELSRRLGRPVEGFEVFVALARQGGSESHDTRRWTYVRKDGSHLPVDLMVTAIRADSADGPGEIQGFLGVAVDLSEREKLRSRLTRALISVDNAADMLFWVGVGDRRIDFVNKAVLTTLGYSRQELIGQDVRLVNPDRDEEAWRRAVEQLRHQGRCVMEASYRKKNGSLFPVEIIASLVTHKGREFAVGIVRDITARKALEADLLRARTLVDSAGDLFFWIGTDDRRIRYVNMACTRVLGYPREELLGMDVARLNPQRTAESWARMVERVRTFGSVTYEVTLVGRDETRSPFEISASLARHEGVEHVQVIARDISERRRMQAKAERQLRVSNALAELARALVDPAATQAGAARLLLERARELTGSPHGLVGAIAPGGAMDILWATDMMPGHDHPQGRQLFAPVDKDRYPGLWGHSLTTRKGFYENNPAGHPSSRGVPEGHLPVLRLLAVPVLVPTSSGPRPIGQIALANAPVDYTAEDLAAVQSLADLYALGSEQLRIRAELVSARDEAQAASRAKSDFLANMTHEVRTPLNGILGMLQLLETTTLDADQADFLAVALGSAAKLSGQLDNVLEFARLDAAGEAECLMFPPTDLLHTLDAQYGPAARAKGLAFEAVAAPGLPELVYSDPQALRQALGHLLDNAIKFTSSGGVRLAALAETRQDPDELVFRVEDTGIGIQEHMKSSIFAAFVQADATTTRRYGGTGLGLAIAAKLAARLGGGVRVEDRPGGGTVMILTTRLDCDPPQQD